MALAVGFVAAIIGQNGGVIAALALFGFVFILAAIPYAILLFFLGRLGTRALVLEQLGAVDSLRRGYALVKKRLGRLLLVGLLAIAVGIVVGIGLAIIGLALVVPTVLITIAAYASGSSAWWLVIVLAALILLPIFLVIAAFLATQSSTYWTLAFRRLEIDRAPAYAYAYPPPQVPAAAAGATDGLARRRAVFPSRFSARCSASFFRPGLTAITFGPRTFLSRALTCAFSFGDTRSNSSLTGRW